MKWNTFNSFGYQIHDDRHDFITTIIISWIIPQFHDERFKCMNVIMTNFMIRIMNLMLTVVFPHIAFFFFFASFCNHQWRDGIRVQCAHSLLYYFWPLTEQGRKKSKTEQGRKKSWQYTQRQDVLACKRQCPDREAGADWLMLLLLLRKK